MPAKMAMVLLGMANVVGHGGSWLADLSGDGPHRETIGVKHYRLLDHTINIFGGFDRNFRRFVLVSAENIEIGARGGRVGGRRGRHGELARVEAESLPGAAFASIMKNYCTSIKFIAIRWNQEDIGEGRGRRRRRCVFHETQTRARRRPDATEIGNILPVRKIY